MVMISEIGLEAPDAVVYIGDGFPVLINTLVDVSEALISRSMGPSGWEA